MKFFKLMKYDIVNGIFKKVHFYFLEIMMCILFFLDFYWNIHSSSRIHNPKAVTFMNYLFYLFQGKEPFDPQMDEAFVFPVIWLLIFLYIAFITLDYPYRNLFGHGTQVIFRTQKRTYWWLSKCLWVFFSTGVYFCVVYLSMLLLCMMNQIDITMHFSKEINKEILDMSLRVLNNKQMLLIIVVLPVITSLTINLIQLCLGLFFDRIYCFLISAVILFASTYFKSPFLIGNYAMIKRSLLYSKHGMSIQQGILSDIFLSIIAIFIGFIRIKKFDIVKKEIEN